MTAFLQPCLLPRCARCGTRPVAVEVRDDAQADAKLGDFCTSCGLAIVHARNAEARQRERERRWTRVDRRGV